ncbi:MAG: transketolase [Deltaproteobacteria bacterium]|nr:transketolase [Deltaproteobacteria bacterium]
MRDTFISELCNLAEADSRIMLLTGDLGFRVLDEYRHRFPAQFLNVGVAEQNMINVAFGMALEGRIVLAYSIANFASLKCVEQIRNGPCYHNANVKIICIGAGLSYGQLGVSHHATEDIAVMRALPDITIFSPGDDEEARECTRALIYTPGAGYIRLEREGADLSGTRRESFELGIPRVLMEGKDLTIISTGSMSAVALEAARILNAGGLSVKVLQCHTLKPLKSERVLEAAAECDAVFTMEEHSVEGGLGGIIAEILLEQGRAPSLFYRFGIRGGFTSIVGDQKYLRSEYGLDAESIATEIRMRLGKVRTIKVRGGKKASSGQAIIR